MDKDKSVIFKGMTAEELRKSYNVFTTIPDPLGWLQKNRERAKLVRDQCKPYSDIAYGEEPLQKLDIYTPAGIKDAPVLVDIHGGGWIAGSKDPRAIVAPAVMAAGNVYVPINYGLAPDCSIDEMVGHIRLALTWIYNNITKYGGDPKKLYIFGNSAGAHLAATALMPGWHKRYGLPEDIIKGAILTSGVYDLEGVVHAHTGAQEDLKMTLEEARRASPIYHLPNRNLPIIIAYGEVEPTIYIRESQDYAKALAQQDCKVLLIEVPGADHFSMINELSNTQGQLYLAVYKMLK